MLARQRSQAKSRIIQLHLKKKSLIKFVLGKTVSVAVPVSLMAKREYPPLFPLGFHPISLADLRLRCVDAFPQSKSRPTIMDGLEHVIGILKGENIVGEVWVDGSFTTEKKEPEDVDIVLYYDGVVSDAGLPSQQAAIDWIDTDLKTPYYCDSYTQFYYPAGHLWYPETDWGRSYWLAKFGFSRAEDPKGLPVIRL